MIVDADAIDESDLRESADGVNTNSPIIDPDALNDSTDNEQQQKGLVNAYHGRKDTLKSVLSYGNSDRSYEEQPHPHPPHPAQQVQPGVPLMGENGLILVHGRPATSSKHVRVQSVEEQRRANSLQNALDAQELSREIDEEVRSASLSLRAA